MNGCAPRPASELELYAQAEAAIANAYAPYSRFAVGAALQPADGAEPITGVNVENASYGLTLCAERSALFAAVADGPSPVRAPSRSTPRRRRARRAARAGRCWPSSRPDITVVYRRGGEVVAAGLDELLPERFEL